MPKKYASIEERFNKFFVQKSPEECWIWNGSLTASGYGSFWYKDKNNPASRIAWILKKGEIPRGKIICHTCDNPRCVNINHLWIGTCKENVRDMVLKNRKPIGERHHFHKVTDKQRLEIIERWANGEVQKMISKEYNITPAAVSYIIRSDTAIKKYGKKNNNIKKTSNQKREEIINMWLNGITQKKIAEIVGLAHSSVNYLIIRYRNGKK